MKKLLLTSISVLALMAPAAHVSAATTQAAPPAASAAPMDVSKIKTEADFRTVLGAAGTVSLMSAQTGVDKASNDMVKEFAKFEVDEQKTVSSILKELKTPMPSMTEADKAKLASLKSTDKGAAFDRMFVQGQLDQHMVLKDICETYLDNGKGTDAASKEARHLAMLALSTINQHIAQAKELLAALK